jgi:hypothetical protein
LGQPDVQPALEAVFPGTIEGEPFQFINPCGISYTDPVKGEVYQPLVIVPPVNVYMQPDLLLFKKDAVAAKSRFPAGLIQTKMGILKRYVPRPLQTNYIMW